MKLTKRHLLQACDMAERAMNEPISTPCGSRLYSQASWDCGTACCIHGFAVLAASGYVVDCGPEPGDYADLEPVALSVVERLLCSLDATPHLVRSAADNGLFIGCYARFDNTLKVGANVHISAYAFVGHNVTIGSNVHIATCALVKSNVCIHDNVTIGQSAVIGVGSVIHSGVTIRDGARIPAGTEVNQNV